MRIFFSAACYCCQYFDCANTDEIPIAISTVTCDTHTPKASFSHKRRFSQATRSKCNWKWLEREWRAENSEQWTVIRAARLWPFLAVAFHRGSPLARSKGKKRRKKKKKKNKRFERAAHRQQTRGPERKVFLSVSFLVSTVIRPSSRELCFAFQSFAERNTTWVVPPSLFPSFLESSRSVRVALEMSHKGSSSINSVAREFTIFNQPACALAIGSRTVTSDQIFFDTEDFYYSLRVNLYEYRCRVMSGSGFDRWSKHRLTNEWRTEDRLSPT